MLTYYFRTIQVSQAVTKDFPDLQLTMGLEVIAGLLYVPLSRGGKDFIAFLRKGQPRLVHWAGKPYKADTGQQVGLEPRTSFKVWSETVTGQCRLWTDEQLETAGVLALVYGKVCVYATCERTSSFMVLLVVHRGMETKGRRITCYQACEHTTVQRQPRR
jgi:light-regulated signal transduction histidine kinase (bacteriophytochrome)